MPGDSSFGQFRAMKFGELPEYIDECLGNFHALPSDRKGLLRTKEELSELCEILRAKSLEPPPRPAFKLSKRLTELQRELTSLQLLISQKSAHPEATTRSLKSLRKQWNKAQRIYDMLLPQEQARHTALRAQYERLPVERSRFVKRIEKDIERVFSLGHNAPVQKVWWRVLPAGQWTLDSVLDHYDRLRSAAPHVRLDVNRLRQVFSLKPSSLCIGLGEFDWYIVFLFPHTTKVVLECPVYGNAIYVIGDNWQALSRLPKNELLAHFPHGAIRIVHQGDWYPRLRAEFYS